MIARVIWLYVLVIFPFCFAQAKATKGAEDRGQSIAEKVYNRPTGKDSVGFAQMLIQPKSGSARKREFFMFQRRPKPNEIASLIRFLMPADVKDVGLLTLDDAGDESDQWIYLSASGGRIRRISSKRKDGSFVNSDIFFEDLRDREVKMDKHVFLGEESVNGVKLYKVESTPVKKDNSAYSKRVAWIHPESWVPIKMEAYKSGRKSPWKVTQVFKLEKVQGIWTVLDSETQNLVTGSKTRMVVKQVKYNLGLPESLFTQKVLEDPRREEKYRQL